MGENDGFRKKKTERVEGPIEHEPAEAMRAGEEEKERRRERDA